MSDVDLYNTHKAWGMVTAFVQMCFSWVWVWLGRNVILLEWISLHLTLFCLTVYVCLIFGRKKSIVFAHTVIIIEVNIKRRRGVSLFNKQPYAQFEIILNQFWMMLKSIVSVILYAIHEAVCIQLTHYCYDDCENKYTLLHFIILIIINQVCNCLGLGQTLVSDVCFFLYSYDTGR